MIEEKAGLIGEGFWELRVGQEGRVGGGRMKRGKDRMDYEEWEVLRPLSTDTTSLLPLQVDH